MIGWIKYLWGWEWSVYVHLYGCGPLIWVENFCFINGFSCWVSVYSPIVIVDGFYLQDIFRRYFFISSSSTSYGSSKPFRWHWATVWSTKWGFVWNSESRGRLRHLTDFDWPWKIIFQCLPDLCRQLFLRRFPYPSNAIVVVVCALNSLVKSHIRELHTRGITAKWVNFFTSEDKTKPSTTEFLFFLII